MSRLIHRALFLFLLLGSVFPAETRGQGDADEPAAPAQRSAETRADAALRMMSRTRFDWQNSVEIESGENTAHVGFTHYSRVCYVDGVWLLKQRDIRAEDWHSNALLVQDGTVYFAEVGVESGLYGGECVTCHASGPRALRGELRYGTEALLSELNERVRKTGPVRPFSPPNDPVPEGKRLELAPCNRCHNGETRAFLHDVQAEPIRYLVEHGHMPPDEELSVVHRRHLYEWLEGQKR